MNETYTFANRKEGWMRVCGAKTLAYLSKEYGDVVLVRWRNGMCSILREAPAIDQGRGGVSGVHISSECMGKLDELRGQPPKELSLAMGPTESGANMGSPAHIRYSKWTHPEGGTIQTKTSIETPITHTGKPQTHKRSKKK